MGKLYTFKINLESSDRETGPRELVSNRMTEFQKTMDYQIISRWRTGAYQSLRYDLSFPESPNNSLGSLIDSLMNLDEVRSVLVEHHKG